LPPFDKLREPPGNNLPIDRSLSLSKGRAREVGKLFLAASLRVQAAGNLFPGDTLNLFQQTHFPSASYLLKTPKNFTYNKINCLRKYALPRINDLQAFSEFSVS
jgi:hypothetical protein